MATSITTNLNDADEAILNRLTDEYNLSQTPSVTPAQFFREHIRDWIRSQASRFLDQDQVGMRAAYKSAPTTVQTQVDTLLAPYR